jgi:putative transposase
VKAFKYKLRPSPRVARTFEHWLAINRELYNAALQERRGAYRRSGISIRYELQSQQLPEIKRVREDVAEVNAQVLQATLRRVDRSFQNFFRRARTGDNPGYPRFKGRDAFTSFTYPQARGAFTLLGRRLHLSKIGTVRAFVSRPLEGTPKTCTIKREADGWYAIITVEEDCCPYYPKTGQKAGADLGIENFLTLSTGAAIANPRPLKRAESALKTAQRAVSRKTKGGKNRQKARARLARAHQKVARCREDFHHKTSLELVRQFDATVWEDLNIVGLLKNHHLAKAIADVGWAAFLGIHFAKAASAGRGVKKVAAAFTSQECSGCGGRVRKPLSQREHRCMACGLVLHRDHNAALVIKARAGPVGMGDGARVNHAPSPL